MNIEYVVTTWISMLFTNTPRSRGKLPMLVTKTPPSECYPSNGVLHPEQGTDTDLVRREASNLLISPTPAIENLTRISACEEWTFPIIGNGVILIDSLHSYPTATYLWKWVPVWLCLEKFQTRMGIAHAVCIIIIHSFHSIHALPSKSLLICPTK